MKVSKEEKSYLIDAYNFKKVPFSNNNQLNLNFKKLRKKGIAFLEAQNEVTKNFEKPMDSSIKNVSLGSNTEVLASIGFSQTMIQTIFSNVPEEKLNQSISLLQKSQGISDAKSFLLSQIGAYL